VLTQVLSYHATAPLQQLDQFKVRTSLSQLLIIVRFYHSLSSCSLYLDKERPKTTKNRRDRIWQSLRGTYSQKRAFCRAVFVVMCFRNTLYIDDRRRNAANRLCMCARVYLCV